MLSDEIKEIPIDPQKLALMKSMIVYEERKNIKTGAFTTTDMVKAIRKIIEKNADNAE